MAGFLPILTTLWLTQPLELEITVAEVQKKRSDTGGVCHDWLQIICDGPGMQVRQSKTPTDFFADDPYARPDAPG